MKYKTINKTKEIEKKSKGKGGKKLISDKTAFDFQIEINKEMDVFRREFSKKAKESENEVDKIILTNL